MKTAALSSLTIVIGVLTAPLCEAATIYAIDFDSTRLSGGNTSGTIDTAPGFTSLDVTNGGTASVTIGTINFALFTTAPNASRVRTQPNALTRDFVFEEGNPGNAVGLTFGGAGALPAGEWRVEVWAWDSSISAQLDPLIIGTRENGGETIHTATFPGSATDPFVATFFSDGISAYDVFVRENNTANKTRLNAVRLTQIPEPSSTLVPGVLGVLILRRRR